MSTDVHEPTPVLFDISKKLDTIEHSSIENPTHYTQFIIEPVTFIAANNLSFTQGNVIKYICRSKMKDGVRDLIKIKRYIDMEIECLKRADRIAAGESPIEVWKENI